MCPAYPGLVGVPRPAQVGKKGVAVAGQGAVAPLQAHQRAALVGERLQHPGPGRQFALLVGVVEEAERSALGPHDGRHRARPFVDQSAYGSPAVLGRHLAQVKARVRTTGPGAGGPVPGKHRVAPGHGP